jgi:hypothetical protein
MQPYDPELSCRSNRSRRQVTDWERGIERGGILAWTLFAVIVIVVLPIVTPSRSLIPLYSAATKDFWSGVDHTAGYYYLPASQIAFTPFAALGNWLGGALWRLLAMVLLTVAGWQWTKLLVADRSRPAFGLFLLLLIPGAAGVLRNGQTDAHMWALTMIAAAEFARGRNWLAAIALALAFALKPQAITALLLMGTAWPRVGARLLPLTFAVLALPFVCADRDFVVRLYVNLAHSIGESVHQAGAYNDLNGMLGKFGIAIPFPAMMGVRIAAGFAAFIVAVASRRILPLPLAAFSAFALLALFLLLFNTREEGSGYIGLALVCAPLAGRAILQERHVPVASILIVVCELVGITGLTPTTLSIFGVWLKPLLACFVGLTVVIPRAFNPRLWASEHDRMREEAARSRDLLQRSTK